MAATIARAAGFPVQQAGTGTTISVTPQAAGDLLIVGVATTGGTNPTITGVSGGGTSGWQQVVDEANSNVDAAIWWAKASTVGAAQTITIAGSGLAGANLRISVDSYTISGQTGATWALDTQAGAAQTAATQVSFPSLTSSATTAPGLYWGVAFSQNGYVAGATAGFGYDVNPWLDGGIAHNQTVAASTAYAPTSGVHGTAGLEVSAAAIFKVTVPTTGPAITRATGFPVQQVGTGLTISVTPQKAGDLLLVGIAVTGSATPAVTGVSGGGTTGWQRATPQLVDQTVLSDLWWAKASTVGSAQTITVAGTNLTGAGIFVRISVDSYTASATTWAVDVASSSAGSGATAVAYPSLRTTGTPPELYWGVGFIDSDFFAGATAGFGYDVNSFGDGGIAHNQTLAAATTYSPTSGVAAAGHYVSSAAIFALAGGAGGGTGTTAHATASVSIGGVMVAKPLMVSKSGSLVQATSIGASSGGGASGGVTVKRAPTGPPTPAGGWTVILADGFDDSTHTLSQLWGPNGNNNGGTGYTATQTPSNSNEVAMYNASQVTLQPDGLHLSAIYKQGVGGAGRDYLSGCLTSQQFISGEPGQQGFPITGFRWLPTNQAVWCFESVITTPDFNDPGQDPGYWFSTPSWLDEIDLFEMWGYGTKPYGYGVTWIYNTSGGSMIQKTAYGDPIQFDVKPHRWTHVFDGPAQRVEVYIDGVHRTDLSFGWPASFSSALMFFFFSHGMRNVYGTPPTFTTGSKEMIIRSCAAYASGSGLTYQGGLIAPGTVLS